MAISKSLIHIYPIYVRNTAVIIFQKLWFDRTTVRSTIMTRGTNLMQQFYYHKYLYMFQASICPSLGVQVVYYCIWCSALGVVAEVLRSRCVLLCTVCKFVSTHHTHTYTHTPNQELHMQPHLPRCYHYTLLYLFYHFNNS
jgi:hypothetical protein